VAPASDLAALQQGINVALPFSSPSLSTTWVTLALEYGRLILGELVLLRGDLLENGLLGLGSGFRIRHHRVG